MQASTITHVKFVRFLSASPKTIIHLNFLLSKLFDVFDKSTVMSREKASVLELHGEMSTEESVLQWEKEVIQYIHIGSQREDLINEQTN